MDNAARTLALVWYFTSVEKYAAKAAALLRYWFFDAATKMNPNLNYAQAVPGVNDGRGTGIIESRALTGIDDAAGLLAGSAAWKESDSKQLQQWYAQYLDWLLTSKNGLDEQAAKNNHGTWYSAQAADFALFTGNTVKARELAEAAKKGVDNQIDGEGKMALELARTNALGYSTFNLQAWFSVATLAQKAGVDLWQYQNKEGGSLRKAFDWLLPYALGQKQWSYKQIGKYNKTDIYPLLMQAAEKFYDPRYLDDAKQVNAPDLITMTGLLYGN